MSRIQKLIEETPSPRTRESLAADLRALGLEAGMSVIAHVSLHACGWVCGGEVAVLQALQDVLTPEGTLMMPTHTTHLTDPGDWQNPPVPSEWQEIIREHTPAFDPARTPSFCMGQTAEAFRSWPGVIRSAHPHYSFAAWGKHARELIEGHALDNGMGKRSPLARLYAMKGHILLLGADHTSNTSLHLAEYMVPSFTPYRTGASILINGKQEWRWFQETVILESSDVFPSLGEAMEAAIPVRKGLVGSAQSLLCRQDKAVDFALQWLMEGKHLPDQAEKSASGAS